MVVASLLLALLLALLLSLQLTQCLSVVIVRRLVVRLVASVRSLAALAALAIFGAVARRGHMQFGEFAAPIAEDHLEALQILGEPDLGEARVDVVGAAVQSLAERQPLFHFGVGERRRHALARLVDGRFHFAQQLLGHGEEFGERLGGVLAVVAVEVVASLLVLEELEGADIHLRLEVPLAQLDLISEEGERSERTFSICCAYMCGEYIGIIIAV